MAEDGAVAEGEDRRHPAPLARQPPVPHRKYARVQPVQPAAARAGVDRAHRQACGPQLTEADHAVLRLGNLRNERVHADLAANVFHTNR